MHLIINTHWDREYRWSFSETQMRLAEAVDLLIDTMEKDKNFKYFHTDSQVSMLDDYLEIRPDKRDRLEKLVKEGRILTGPWYTLPAEFLVSGEALVRNLQFGHKLAKDLGKVMKAAYNIFSWGQISQLPQIYKQFGMDTIIFYRGVDQSKLDTLEFMWQAPDGTAALGLTFGNYHRLNFWRYVYLPYIFGTGSVEKDIQQISREQLQDAHLFQICGGNIKQCNHKVVNQPFAYDLDGALGGMKQLMSSVEKSSTKELLFLQGFDQENPDPTVTKLIEDINRNIDYGKITVSSIEDYVSKIKKELTENSIMEKLPVLKGEMLEVEKVHDAFGPLYNGVFSARMPVKLQNANCQYLLENIAEPFACINYMLGGCYPTLFMEKAWKELLKNQQHDGIGGCHVDRVFSAMEERYRFVQDISESVVRDSYNDIVSQMDFSELSQDDIGVVVFNTTQFERDEIILATVDFPTDGKRGYEPEISAEIYDEKGNEVPMQFVSIENEAVHAYLKYGNVINFNGKRMTVALQANDVPSYGFNKYKVRPSRKIQRKIDLISPEPLLLENEYISALINSNGTIDVVNKITGRKFNNIHYFEDSSECGGPLVFQELNEKGTATTLSQSPAILLKYNGPLFATYEITYKWELPEGVDSDIKIHVPHGSQWIDQGRLKRSKHLKTLTITSLVTLKKHSKTLHFETVVDNTICDHRLRVVMPTDFSDVISCKADSPFDVVEGEIDIPDSTGWYEAAAKTYPSQSFVALYDGNDSVCVSHHGIPEYEVTADKKRAISLTLLRSFGTAGNPTETYEYQELAQCLGKHKFMYNFTCGVEYENKSLLKCALTNNIPLQIAQTTRHSGKIKQPQSFVEVSNDNFIVTALKEQDNCLLLRGYNCSDSSICLNIQSAADIKRIKKITLEGIEVGTYNADASIEIGAKEIASFLLEI